MLTERALGQSMSVGQEVGQLRVLALGHEPFHSIARSVARSLPPRCSVPLYRRSLIGSAVERDSRINVKGRQVVD
jgi:hypothetical protein